MTAIESAAEQGRLDTVQRPLSTDTRTSGHLRDELSRAIALTRSNGHMGVVYLL